MNFGLNENDDLTTGAVTLNLGQSFVPGRLNLLETAPMAALASAVCTAGDAGSFITQAVDCAETSLDEEFNLQVIFHLAMTGMGSGVNRVAYHVTAVAQEP